MSSDVSTRLRIALRFAVAVAVGSMSAGPIGAVDGENSIVPENAQLELLFDGGVFLEGPAVGPDGTVYFSDITNTAITGMQAGYLWRYEPSSGKTTIFRSPSGMSNGIIFDLEDRMVVAQGADFGGRCVTRTDMTTGKSEIIAGLYNGRPFNSPNDLAVDEQGRVYFTDPRYVGHEPIEQPVMGVYRIDPDGSVSLIITDAGTPNGILVAPDQRTLYVASIGLPNQFSLHALLAYDLAEDGSVSSRRVLVDFAPELGPDGMAVDVDGNLYLARPALEGHTPGIYVYSPDGEQLAVIPTPVSPANAAFGRGPTGKTLYITAGANLYKIELARKGYHPAR
jgi:gluconolactonase